MQRLLLALPLLLSSACGSFTLHPVATPAARPIASVVVQLSDELHAHDAKREHLLSHDVPGQMQRAIAQSLPTGGQDTLVVTITAFRTSIWAPPARMHAVVQLVSPHGHVLSAFEADATTIRKSGWRSSELVAQDVVRQCVEQMSI